MGRTVTAVVTIGTERIGVAEPFTVDSPWWADVGPVTELLGESLGVSVFVLRLLRVNGGDSGREGHVTYHVEAAGPPAAGRLTDDTGADDLAAPQRFRAPWATADGLRELLGWAADSLAAAGRPVTGPVAQHRTWNLAGLFRLPTAAGPVWLKAGPHFAADEATLIAAVARHDPGLVPRVVAAGEHRVLLEHLPGRAGWQAGEHTVASAVHRLVAVQTELAGDTPPALPDRRAVAGRVRELLDGPAGAELTAGERAAAHRLAGRWSQLADCGLPDTVVHGDFHAGNWRVDGLPVVLDWADAHVGNPVLDGLRVGEYLPAATRPAAARAWVDAWREHRPGSAPDRALAVAEPLAHLAYAVRYQEFLDGIEPSERIYHLGDPAAAVRAALRVAMEPSGWTRPR